MALLLLAAGWLPAHAQAPPLARAAGPAAVVHAQAAATTAAPARALTTVLQELESRFDVEFLYRADRLDDQQVRVGDYAGRTLEQLLDEAFGDSELTCRKLDGRRYAVVPRAEETRGGNLPARPARLLPALTGRALTMLPVNVPVVAVVVSGVVRDADNSEPIPGVNVLETGTVNGTITDVTGRYSLTVSGPDAVLSFSSIGYLSQQRTVGQQTTLDVELPVDVQSLEEVVVVGFGTQEKRALTGAISQLKTQAIENNVNADPVTALQGNVSGVQVTQSSGQPGGAVRIRVRGTTSLLSGGDPLVIVDGVPVITSTFGANSNAGISGLSEINPNDIASIEVLKDAASAAIYGARAANGVVLVTTKRGKAGQRSLNINFEQGVTTVTNRVDLLSGPELLAVNRRAIQNRGNSAVLGTTPFFGIPRNVDGAQGFDSAAAVGVNTNWMDQVLQTGRFTNANISGSVGSEKLSVFGSAGLRQEEGVEIGRKWTRATARINTIYDADMFSAGANFSLSYLERQNPGDHFGTAQSSALPYFPINAPDNPSVFFNGFNRTSGSPGTNPLFFRENYSNQVNTFRNLLITFAELRPVPGLRLRTEWGLDYQTNNGDIYESRELFPAVAYPNNGARGSGNGRATTRRFQSLAWNNNTTATYDWTVANRHNFTVLGGMQLTNQRNEGRSYVSENFPFEYFKGSGNEVVVSSPSASSFRFTSFFSRVDYNFANKYYLQGSIRTDQSSRFGPGKRQGTFGGGSLGWALSEEDFLSSVSWLDRLKLRASYGTVGNADLPGNFLYLSTGNVVDSEIGYGGYRGIAFQRLGNENLKWETTVQFNVGLDFSLFNNRIGGSIDAYDKLSKDLLLTTNIPNSTGFIDNTLIANVGSVRNRGVELNLNSVNVDKGGFRWTSNFNITHNVGKVLKLAPPVNVQDTRIPFLNVGDVRLVEGEPYGAFFLPVYAGTDPETGDEFIYAVDQEFLTTTGIARSTDTLVNAGTPGLNPGNQRQLLTDRTTQPDFYGGFSNTFAYKGFDLNVLLYFQVGN